MLVLKPILATCSDHKHAAKWLWTFFCDLQVFLKCEKSQAPVFPNLLILLPVVLSSCTGDICPAAAK